MIREVVKNPMFVAFLFAMQSNAMPGGTCGTIQSMLATADEIVISSEYFDVKPVLLAIESSKSITNRQAIIELSRSLVFAQPLEPEICFSWGSPTFMLYEKTNRTNLLATFSLYCNCILWDGLPEGSAKLSELGIQRMAFWIKRHYTNDISRFSICCAEAESPHDELHEDPFNKGKDVTCLITNAPLDDIFCITPDFQ